MGLLVWESGYLPVLLTLCATLIAFHGPDGGCTGFHPSDLPNQVPTPCSRLLCGARQEGMFKSGNR